MPDSHARERADLSWFDEFADSASNVTGQAPFFAGCVALVVLWLPSYFIFGKINTWQLVINTITTIVTFLLVALLQNTQRRNEVALHKKLNAIAAGLADLMESLYEQDPSLAGDMENLSRSVGLEDRVGGRTSSRWKNTNE